MSARSFPPIEAFCAENLESLQSNLHVVLYRFVKWRIDELTRVTQSKAKLEAGVGIEPSGFSRNTLRNTLLGNGTPTRVNRAVGA